MISPIVTVHNGIHVVRDDLFLGGTKARFLPVLFDDAEEVVYASPCEGGAQTALAHAVLECDGASQGLGVTDVGVSALTCYSVNHCALITVKLCPFNCAIKRSKFNTLPVKRITATDRSKICGTFKD